MTNVQDLQSMLPLMEAIPAKDVVAPGMPVATYIQEAENLNAWMQADRALLVAHGQPDDLLDSLPARTGALREAESEWDAARYDREHAKAEYERESSLAFDLFAHIVRHFRYAFRKHPALLARLPRSKAWSSDVERIQDLNNVAVMGREHLGLLAAAGFHPARLDELAALSDALADKYALARGEKASGRGSKILRDRAFTLLKTAVDEIRAAGRFLFWNDETRLQGYRSEYARKNRMKGDDADAEAVDEATSAAASSSSSSHGMSAEAKDATL